ncbi:MAG: DNA-3-methyladenine glycosylase I [Candidatus Nomurabacteria bacterium]|nr:DNA-3-methyladenine glycosylase I [Candidatus Nomurabacteria bacterium]
MKLTHPYCNYVSKLTDINDVDKTYHDNHYGVRIEDDNELFGRLIMEINQAGLSWRTILIKENGFRKAYNNFDIKKIAKYSEKDFLRLMNDVRIIRNKLKINAAIYNAQEIIKIQKEFGSFRKFLDFYVKENKNDKNLWLKLFKKHFKFVGGEIVGEFLLSIDMLSGNHDKNCIVKKKNK